ncbi:MAG: c-type cytochrome domain-containing protein [Planctomycetota bacterium]|nr:c-type cytochrome domain-containing protein [Planctomycetota bacterium]
MFEEIAVLNGQLIATAGDSATWVFLGRLHPLLIHFPIAMILAAAAVEVVQIVRANPRPSRIAGFCTWFGTIVACLATWCGWALGEEHGSGTTLELHRWFGVATTAILIWVVISWCIERASRSNWSFQSYRVGLWVAAILMVVTSMFGGEMVWGEGWLTEPLFDETQPVETEETSVSPLEAEVAAIFAARCEECHGPTKQKGGLQLVPLAAAFAETEEEHHVIAPGDAEGSELVERITLPVDHDDHMPPKGEPLTEEQVSTIREWIAEGAHHGSSSDADGSAVGSDEAPSITDRTTFDAGLAAIADRGAVVTALHEGSDWFEVNASIAKPPWTDADMSLLEPVALNIWRLNLGRSGITDEGMNSVAACRNLRILFLDRTGIGDAGIEHVADMKHLQRLNIFGTQAGDGCIDVLEKLPALTHVYLWDSKVTKLGADTLRVARPSIVVDTGDGLESLAPPAAAEETPTSQPEPESAPEPAPEPPPEAAPEPVAPPDGEAQLPACCKTASDAGGECDHPCCVEARAKGEICPKCSK